MNKPDPHFYLFIAQILPLILSVAMEPYYHIFVCVISQIITKISISFYTQCTKAESETSVPDSALNSSS